MQEKLNEILWDDDICFQFIIKNATNIDNNINDFLTRIRNL